jgi:hypothetical protein
VFQIGNELPVLGYFKKALLSPPSIENAAPSEGNPGTGKVLKLKGRIADHCAGYDRWRETTVQTNRYRYKLITVKLNLQ